MGVVTLAYGKRHWENHMQPLEFWSQVMPPAVEIYASFEKQLLACDWILVETEHLAMDMASGTAYYELGSVNPAKL